MNLSFIGVANMAYKMVNAKYPGSKLLEADGITPKGGTTNPKEVTHWTFVFRTSDGGTAMITTSTWGHFNPIKYVPQPYLEDMVIPWPVKMDIGEADKLLKNAGHTGAYKFVNLRWPLYPGNTEPYYIFTMNNGDTVFVGTNTKTVKEVVKNASELTKPTRRF